MMTKHSTIRAKQRGIPSDVLGFILEHGNCRSAKGGALKYEISTRKRNHLIRSLMRDLTLLQKTSGVSVIANRNADMIITAYRG